MRFFTKKASLIIALALIFTCFSGCSQSENKESGKIKIVCTVFPVYDFVKEITGDKADIIWLLKSGADMHSYQPTAADIVKIADCDALVYIGGESDAWIDSAVKQYGNNNRTVIKLMEVLGDSTKAEEYTEGMQHEKHKNDKDTEPDEHIWLSLKNAKLFTENISSAICEKDPENVDFYRQNSADYIEKLTALDGEYRIAAQNARHKTLIFADRFPFLYLTEDYGLSYYAAFPGCSAETEASFETIAFLSQKTDELGLEYIMTTENTSTKIAETVAANTRLKNQKILSLDSMQAITEKDAASGVSYLSVMEKNLKTLKKALGEG